MSRCFCSIMAICAAASLGGAGLARAQAPASQSTGAADAAGSATPDPAGPGHAAGIDATGTGDAGTAGAIAAAAGDPAGQAIRDMDLAAGRLLEQADAGDATQALQRDALEHLRRLMEAMNQQQSAGQGESADPSPSPQQPSQQRDSAEQGPQRQSQAAGQQGGESGQSRDGQTASKGGDQAAQESYLPGNQAAASPVAGLPSLLGDVEAWGFLPPDQRRQVLQGMQVEPPARYRKLTERYWRLLNEAAGEE